MFPMDDSKKPTVSSSLSPAKGEISREVGMQPTRILLADDHDVVRKGLRGILEAQPGWQVCGEASNGREAVRLVRELEPQIVVLDLETPELNGLEATRQIKKEFPDTEVLIFTMHETEQLIRDVLAAGARGYVLKSDAGRHLVDAIEALARKKPFFTTKASETLLEEFLESAPAVRETSVLTAREREIVQLLAEEKSTKKSPRPSALVSGPWRRTAPPSCAN